MSYDSYDSYDSCVSAATLLFPRQCLELLKVRNALVWCIPWAWMPLA